MMQTDALRTFALVGLSAVAILFLQGKIQSTVMLAVIGVLTVVDLFGIGMRYLTKEDFQRPASVNQVFEPRDVDKQILADKDPYYRVFDATINAFNSSIPSYHHKMVGGYHAAKLQRYQDLIDYHLSQSNQQVFNMLNTKYFIIPGQDGQPVVQQTQVPKAMDGLWIVLSWFPHPMQKLKR
ncbi:MAG: hypothetical protein R2795_16510 [Saprospiraceae bacterium]